MLHEFTGFEKFPDFVHIHSLLGFVGERAAQGRATFCVFTAAARL